MGKRSREVEGPNAGAITWFRRGPTYAPLRTMPTAKKAQPPSRSGSRAYGLGRGGNSHGRGRATPAPSTIDTQGCEIITSPAPFFVERHRLGQYVPSRGLS